ncbi:MAG: LacI family DNA-binding transcriptional regulator [Limnochordia bacterium]
MPVTVRDIARELNISPTTVSNVLRGKGRASKETTRKVLEAARKSGYLTQEGIAHSKLLGFLFCVPPDRPKDHVTRWSVPEAASDYTSEAAAGIQKVVGRYDYSMVFNIIDYEEFPEHLPDMVEQRAIDGLLVVGGSISDAYIRELRSREIPMVLLFTHVENARVNSVLADNAGGAYQVIEHLLALGHRRIGFINSWAKTHTSEQKLAGYNRGLHSAGLPLIPELVRTGDFTLESGYQAAYELLSLAERPSALFVADDTMAIGAMRAAKALGLSVPQDCSVVGYGDSQLSAFTEPQLTTVHVPKRVIGELAGQRLMDMLVHKKVGPELSTVVATELVVRQSTAAPSC